MPILPEIQKAVQALIDDREVPVISKMKKIDKIGFEHHFLWKEKLKVGWILTHPKNRAGLLINPRDAHRNQAQVRKVGCDPNQLHGSYAFSAPMDASEHIAANSKLVASSGGLLAPVTGAERFFSVGCGHFTSGCRAVEATCVTFEKTIADASGRLDIAYMRRDEEYAKLLDEGWEWNVFHPDAEETWPELPDLYSGPPLKTSFGGRDFIRGTLKNIFWEEGFCSGAPKKQHSGGRDFPIYDFVSPKVPARPQRLERHPEPGVGAGGWLRLRRVRGIVDKARAGARLGFVRGGGHSGQPRLHEIRRRDRQLCSPLRRRRWSTFAP